MTKSTSKEITLEYAGPFVKLLRIKLKNFLSISSFEHDFNQPISLIVGPNGSGKSSIFEAIYFAFNCRGLCRFNKFVDAVKLGEKEAFVEVEFFTKKNHKYVLTHHIHDNLDDVSVACDGKSVYTRKSEVTGFLAEIGASNAFSRTLPGGFHLINDSLSLNYNLLEQISPYCLDLKKATEKLYLSLPEDDTAYQKADNLLQIYKNQHVDNAKLIKSLKEQISNLQSSFNVEEDLISEDEVKEAYQKMEALENEVMNLTRKQEALKHATKRLNEITSQLLEAQNKSTKAEEELSNKLDEIKSIKSQMNDTNAKKDDATKRLEVANQSLLKTTFSLQAAIKKYDTLKNGQCPTCNQTIESASIIAMKDDVETYETKRSFAAQIVQKLTEEKQKYMSIINDLNDKLNAANTSVSLNNSVIKSQASLIDRLKEEKAEKETEVNESTTESLSQIEADYKASKEDYNEKSAKLSSNQSIQKAKELSEKTMEQLADAEKEASSVEEKIKSQQATVDDLKKNYDEKAKAISLMNEKVLPQLVLMFSQYVEIAMNEILEKFEYEIVLEVSDRKANYLLSKGDYSFQIAYISSFEKELVSIASDIALLKINRYPVLLLDEPDRAATPQNSEKVASYLLKMCLDNDISQSIIITHNQMTQNVLQDNADIIQLEKAEELSI